MVKAFSMYSCGARHLSGSRGVWVWFCAFTSILALPPVCTARAQELASGDGITVTAEGMAALGEDFAGSREEAIWDAKRNAVEIAAGVLVRSHTVGRDFVQESDLIQSSTQGFIRAWQVVAGSQRVEAVGPSGNGRLLRLRVQATVAMLPVIHRLADIADLYNDLERPRLRIELAGDADSSARDALSAAFKQQGFDLVRRGPAEIELVGRLRTISTVPLGRSGSPYGVGENVAASRVVIVLQAISTVSEAVLCTLHVEGDGQSFQGDGPAAEAALQSASQALIEQSHSLFIEPLLAHWAQEREEGHTVAIRARGLKAEERDRLRRSVLSMRGLVRLLDAQTQGRQWTLRFVTRLATRDVRRRLNDLPRSYHLKLLNDRGPLILCAAK